MLRRLVIAVAVPLAAGCTCAQLPTDVVFCPEDGGSCDAGGLTTDGGMDAGRLPDGGCMPFDCAAQMLCGTHLDSCGMPVDCHLCPEGNTCTNGVCTHCSLAVDTPDPPDDAFTDSDCDGIDGEARAAVFVDPNAPADGGDGSMDHPVKTLQEALTVAMMRAAPVVLVSGGTFNEGEVDWTGHISVYGGYHADRQWQRDDTRALLDGGALALHISGAGGIGITWDRVDVSSAPGAVGESSIALVVQSSSLALEHVTLLARNGGNGADGTATPGPAADGKPGFNGANGTSSIDGSDHGAVNGGGAPAFGVCSDSADGGIGASDMATAGGDAHYGSCNILGGASSFQPMFACGPTPPRAQDGASGSDGPDGAKGSDGDGGLSRGLIVAGRYQPSDGTAGQSGKNGTPGCSGAGGGASSRSNGLGTGGGGGSSGTGGCGGDGGSPGHGGGASIALLAINAGVTVYDVRAHAGQGGNGGRGYPGQQGGAGGKGGHGGKGGDACSTDDGGFPNGPGNAGDGGNGGNGGAGGDGGNAGGGGGGPSIGIWCVDGGRVTIDAGLKITALDGGAGGPGGGAGLNGQWGLLEDLLDCPP
jgi:hypothetical protein